MTIKEKVYSDLSRILKAEEIDGILKYGCYFDHEDPENASGLHLFKDGEEFVCVEFGDRGELAKEIRTTNMKEILAEVYLWVTDEIAVKYAVENRDGKKDWRRWMFPKQLQLLKGIDEYYYNLGQEEINAILKDYPYKDKD